jgi:AcrR family transcriptional regulator
VLIMKGQRTAPADKATTTRDALLDAAEELMRQEGYAAVSTRRLAAMVGVKGPMIHYYFKTMDDLFVAVFRRLGEQGLERLKAASSSASPLHSIWEHSKGRATLFSEFIALANHRKAIRVEIANYAVRSRNLQIEAVSRYLRAQGIDLDIPVGAIPAVLTGLSYLLTMEQTLGVAVGYADAETLVETCLRRLEGQGAARDSRPHG